MTGELWEGRGQVQKAASLEEKQAERDVQKTYPEKGKVGASPTCMNVCGGGRGGDGEQIRRKLSKTEQDDRLQADKREREEVQSRLNISAVITVP